MAGGLVIAAIGWLGLRARRRPLTVGIETMIGAAVEAVNDCQDRCVVRYGAELWNARTSTPLHAGQQARIVKGAQMRLWGAPQQDKKDSSMIISLPVIVVILLLLVASSLRVLKEYERGVMFTLGRFTGVKGPGVRLVLPVIQQMKKLELRTVVLNVPKQDVISRDNVSVKVSAVVYFRIVDPAQAILQVATPWEATSQLAQTTLRSVTGQHELDEMLSQRDKLNAGIQQILDANTAAWGMKVSNVEIKDIDLDETMIRAMARQAEAERARRAKIIHAEGEKQAAQTLAEAARLLSEQPASLQLRYLQTLADISNEKSSIIVFPLPIDLIAPLLRSMKSD